LAVGCGLCRQEALFRWVAFVVGHSFGLFNVPFLAILFLPLVVQTTSPPTSLLLSSLPSSQPPGTNLMTSDRPPRDGGNQRAKGPREYQRYRNNNDIVALVPPHSFGYRHCGETLYIWPAGMITRNPSWLLKLIQRIKPYTEGIIGDGVADHSIEEYSRCLKAVRIDNV